MIKNFTILGMFLFGLMGCQSIFSQVAEQVLIRSSTEVTDADLNKFVDAYQTIQVENKKAEERLVAIIQREDLDVKRFRKIRMAIASPSGEKGISENEMKSYKRANTGLERMRAGFKQKMAEIIVENGLTVERFNQILNMVPKDKILQEKVKLLLKG